MVVSKKVFVVDDHTDTRIICRELLTHFGYTVLEAADGIEAVDIAFTHLPDLILLDFLMPHSDGVATLAEIRAHASLDGTAVVIFTAATSHAEQLAALAGVQRLIFKPIQTERLLGVVRELIGDAMTEPLP